MRYLLGGLTSATLVGLSSILVYGPGSQLQISWLEPAFWALITSGAVMSLFEDTIRCKLCTIRELLSGGPDCSEDTCAAH